MARACRTTITYLANSARFAPRFIRNDKKSLSLLPLQDNRKRHEPKHSRLEPRVLAQENGHVAHKRHVSQHTANNILLAVEEALAARVKLRVVCGVVVAFCQELEGCASVGINIVSNPFRTSLANTP